MPPRLLFALILFVAIFVMSVVPVTDADFFWHLRTGQYIIETRTIPHTDIYSFTKPGAEWITHEWLSEVMVYALYTLGSFPLLILVFSGIVILAFLFAYLRCEGRPYFAAIAVLLGVLATAPIWGVRPQMLSLLLTSIFLFLLDRFRTRGADRWIWLLPSLMLVWVNLHSGFFLGLVVVGVFMVGETVPRVIMSLRGAQSAKQSPTPPQPSPLQGEGEGGVIAWLAMTGRRLRMTFSRDLLQLALVFVLCLAAVMVNPNGARMYVYPFETLTSSAMQKNIVEWFSPDFHRLEFQPFALLLLALFAALALARKPLSLTDLILLLGFGYASLRSARLIPLFALVAIPILANQLWAIVESAPWLRHLGFQPALTAGSPGISDFRFQISDGRWQIKKSPISNLQSAINWLLLLLILFASAIRVGSVIADQPNQEARVLPKAAVDFVQATKPRGNLYNWYNWGGYLIWRLYPDYRVYIDGRADVYGDAFIENFLKVYRAQTGWEETLAANDVRLVFIEPTAPLAGALRQSAGWAKAYEDERVVVWERR